MTKAMTLREKSRGGIPLSEIEAVQRRVGVEPRDRLQWAIRFVQHGDPETSGDWLNLRMEVFAFASSLVWWDRIPPAFRDELKEQYGRTDTGNQSITEATLPTAEQVRKVRDSFREILKALQTTGKYAQTIKRTVRLNLQVRERTGSGERVIDYVPTAIGQWQDRLGGKFSAFWRFPFTPKSKDVTEGARTHFLDLLEGSPGDLLRICPEQHSQRIFVAKRPNQDFCSTTCQNRAAQRDSRERKGKMK